MSILGIDAARGGFSAAIASDGTHAAVERRLGEALERGMGAIDELLRASRPARVERIAVGIGPGSFTGVRIAISYAKALALAWDVPLAGVDTFDALEAGTEWNGRVMSVVEGRKGVVSARYRDGAHIWRSSGYVDDVAAAFGEHASPAKTPISLVGDAQGVSAALAERGWVVNVTAAKIAPPALAVALVGAHREPARSLHEVRADYGELPPAKVPVLRKAPR